MSLTGSHILVLAVLGILGTLCRYFLSVFVHQVTSTHFPFGTLTINMLGCFLVGLLGTLADERSWISPQIKLVIMIGFLGAFTTFSSFAYETWMLMREGHLFLAGANLCATMGGCFAGLGLGIFAARQL